MGKYLDFYKKCMETETIPYRHSRFADGGLCGVLGARAMEIFTPTEEDCDKYDVRAYGYYGRDEFMGVATGFGPTRQNFALFLAAMNDEL